MGLPKIEIIFKTLGASAIKRGERGIVALILKDNVSIENPILMYGVDEIPTDLNEFNKKQIELAFMGGINSPRKVIAYIIPAEATDYTEVMKYLETIRWNYLAIPEIDESDTMTIATWIKGLRDNKDMGVKAVLPNESADDEGIINFTTDDIKIKDKTYTAAEYCSRIAGMAAGCPLTVSLTYQLLSEVDDVPHLTTEEFDKAIDEGKLVLMNDGEKVKIARGVNSLVSTTKDKGEEFQKILIVDKVDMWKDDVKRTVADNYLGKYANTYDNKILLITAIQAYNDKLEMEGILDSSLPDYNKVFVDLESQTIYLKSIGVDIENMKEQDIKQANTKDKVFIGSNIKFTDAMEDFEINVTM